MEIQTHLCDSKERSAFQVRAYEPTIRLNAKPAMCLVAWKTRVDPLPVVGDLIRLKDCNVGESGMFRFNKTDDTIRSNSHPLLCFTTSQGLRRGSEIKLDMCRGSDDQQFEAIDDTGTTPHRSGTSSEVVLHADPWLELGPGCCDRSVSLTQVKPFPQ